MCARNIFSEMNLSWHMSEPPVHIYFSMLWENKYKKSYSMICDLFLAHLYFIIFHQECPRLSKKLRRFSHISTTGILKKNIPISGFSEQLAPSPFSMYVPNKVVLGEIFYQTILQGFNASLIKYKKRVFIPYGFQLGYYFVKDTPQARQEGLSHVEYRFDPENS
jgi:hypothetical protein